LAKSASSAAHAAAKGLRRAGRGHEAAGAAFVLKNHQGLSIKEIAELMDTAEGTVKVHLHRAVIALRARLAEFV
jgi:DNA-directed RNA polymerase specialized sigma24 family protein